ncbi:MAG TPA: F0F1 ATP synthase subunit gamma [Steroidobacteraceae bacterium]|jgi:F-type H+-transporting ATPase subunit gamma|nr:F0F1 ATP synthase subunit gamma [Steroidobacteraceae bacterium]
MRLAEIERHVSSMRELGHVVGAMRAIASMHMQEAVRALASVREYGRAMSEAVREALAIAAQEARLRPDKASALQRRDGRRVIVLFTSEHGFVGGFNERLLEAAAHGLDTADTLVVVGSRGAALAGEHGVHVTSAHAMATRLGSIPEIVRRVQEALYPSLVCGEVGRAEVLFGGYRRSAAAAIERRQLFPLEIPAAEARGSRLAPLHTLPAQELLEKLTGEYMLSQLMEAAAESLAAENSARFAAMDAAHENVARKLEKLRLDASRARQEEVTTELLDLVTGEEALRARV